MQSSYKIIKHTVIGENALVSPPIIDKLYEKISSAKYGNEQNNHDDIYKALAKEASAKRDEIIKRANEEAELIRQNAIKEAEEIKKQVREDGYQEGYRHGYQEGYDYGINEANNEGKRIKDEAQLIRSQAEEYFDLCHEESRKYIKECEREIIKLSVDIARQIVNTELTINPEAIYKIAERLISKTTDKKQIIIKVNPQDFNIIKNRKEELAMYVEDSNNIIIIADTGVKHGSIKAETPSGFIDADTDTQLNVILKKLLGE